MAAKAQEFGVLKAGLPILNMLALVILAGAFISTGAPFATTVSAASLAVRSTDGTLALSTGLP